MLSLLRYTVAALALVSANVIAANAADLSQVSSRQRCFIEPFPDMLMHDIQEYRRCGLNNPHVIDVVCAPVRGLAPDAKWLEWQLSQFEDENVQQQQDSKSPASDAFSTLTAHAPLVLASGEPMVPVKHRSSGLDSHPSQGLRGSWLVYSK